MADDCKNTPAVIAATSATKNLTCLYDCIERGDIASLQRLLSAGTADINSILHCKGVGIIHLAVGVDPLDVSVRCTEIILQHGGDPNVCSEDGMTPVHVAAIWGRLENLKLLLACGGDPTVQDEYDMTAYHYALREHQYDVVEYLDSYSKEYQENTEEKEIETNSPCRYSLILDRVLVSTGHVVAEYGTLDDVLPDKTLNKSSMVREWCEQTSRVNQLYPTILNQTYRIQDESKPWQTGQFTNEKTFDVTTTSYKSCDSTISGVEPLTRTTEECDCICHSEKKNPSKERVSVYENFSLPGSPTNIIHYNYNNKTSIRAKSKSSFNCKKSPYRPKKKKKIKRKDSIKKLSDSVVIVQNETNEWLSHSHSMESQHDSSAEVENLSIAERSLIEADTRRVSQRSSGISTVSSGSIALASVQEEYKYEDKEENVVLIEKRLLVPSVVVSIDESAADEVSPEESRHSLASSLPASLDYDVHTLRAELTARGFTPGPINTNTKKLYLRKLKNLKRNPVASVDAPVKNYSVELQKSLKNATWFSDLTPYIELEIKARANFSDPANSAVWREGSAKTSFTYLLLDPRLTADLPARAPAQHKHATWTTFVNSIFYVGKGKRSRPYSHLYQALKLWKRDFRVSHDKKAQHILDIWKTQMGVICLHVFQNMIPAEAYTYEAAMIDVLGVQNVRNLKIGNYYGAVSRWPAKDKRMFGLYLLYKAMLIFLSEGERQLRPEDID